MPTFHIHIKGRVQGVGFRPFVYGLAQKYKLMGTVSNGNDGVHIHFNASSTKAINFLEDTVRKCPEQAKVSDFQLREIETLTFNEFKIVASDESSQVDLAITPDFGICPECKQELKAKDNRRYQYAFITCTNCGPRYSIMDSLPYDRHRTSMKRFLMCNCCNEEYREPTDRRYFSQTNSCQECGVNLKLLSSKGEKFKKDNVVFNTINKALKSGSIIAVKGIGGYLLMCDATNTLSIQKLRERKQRKHKPFAILYPSKEIAAKDVHVTSKEVDLLESSISPILLLKLKKDLASGLAKDIVAPGLNHIGVMLPYAPLLELIASNFGKPLVATSANLSGSPIVYKDDIALNELFNFADYILMHNRCITSCQDDSVIRLSPSLKEEIILRRSRGLAPSFFHQIKLRGQHSLLALGAQMKSAFAVLERNNFYVSQYLGSLDGYEAQVSYRETLNHFLELVQSQPKIVLTDTHPNYFTTQLGEDLKNKWNISLKTVQHHEAHFAAVLGENDLHNSQQKILGVIWDGTGFGDDRQIWGGEFFQFNEKEIQRQYHFEYFPVLSGDKMMKEPRLSALSLTQGYDKLNTSFTQKEWAFYNKLLKHNNQLQTSSVGRIFDAIACLLGLVDKATFEGQAGMLLEQLAQQYFENNKFNKVDSYRFEINENNQISIYKMVKDIISDVQSKISKSKIAARFHLTMVSIIDAIASKENYQHIAFSGGVFQNGVLVDLIKLQLQEKYQLYFHKQLSPNDENIAFGQIMHYLIHSKIENKLTDEYLADIEI